jgi:D-alanyl-D-alanine carboxypeptidase (penicillin-binding protein 5/6)
MERFRSPAAVLGAIVLGAASPCASAALPSLVKADSILVVDAASGKHIAGVRENERREVASLQKLLTALLILQAGQLDKPVTITAADASCPPTKLPHAVGATYTRRELLEAVLVRSANDAARALARDHSGSEEAFALKMTQLARRLGARNSVFKTSTGLPATGQYSTASDMALIAREAYGHPEVRRMAQIKYLPWRDGRGHQTTLKNSNRLLHRHPECGGLKIGYTGAAGHCAAAVWQENRRSLIAIVLGGRDQMFWLQTGVVLKLYANGLL